MLQMGIKAPHFEGADENGNVIKLSDFARKKHVLYFYPKGSAISKVDTKNHTMQILK